MSVAIGESADWILTGSSITYSITASFPTDDIPRYVKLAFQFPEDFTCNSFDGWAGDECTVANGWIECIKQIGGYGQRDSLPP